MEYYLLAGAIIVFIVLGLIIAASFRTVVSTNDVHIVQSAKRTISYGKDQDAGNTYYAWPSWLPRIGIRVIKLPVSVFNVELDSYAAYDKGRVPFNIDILAFFRIGDSNTAAQRVHSFPELLEQLQGIVQGVCRSILAKSDIEEILEERNKFGQMFTDAVQVQLKEWGVVNVKNIELMDVRDAPNSKVIENIMAKKKSAIEMESRIAVANNQRAAQEAEITAKRQVALQEQEALEQVGKRTATKDQAVGIANQQAVQAVKEQEKLTAEKQMAVSQVQQVRTAEIQKDVQIVNAEQVRRTSIIQAEGQAAASVAAAQGRAQTAVVDAEGHKKQTVLNAEGNLAQAQLHAQGVEAEGLAKGAADTAVNMATISPQIALAKEIGNNKEYQAYLVTVRKVEASQAVGVAQAEALKAASIKVIANSGNVIEGVDNVMDLLTSKGGTQLGAMLEGLANTDAGAALLEKVGVKSQKQTGNGASH